MRANGVSHSVTPCGEQNLPASDRFRVTQRDPLLPGRAAGTTAQREGEAAVVLVSPPRLRGACLGGCRAMRGQRFSEHPPMT